MVIFGHEVPDVMMFKLGAAAALGLLVGAYELWRGRRIDAPGDPELPPEPAPGVVKTMGMVEEVPPDQRRP